MQLGVFIGGIKRQFHSAFSGSETEVQLVLVDITIVNKSQSGVTLFSSVTFEAAPFQSRPLQAKESDAMLCTSQTE